MKPSPLRDRSAAFAKDIVFAVRALRDQHVESILLNQLLRCGTSVGANIHEAQVQERFFILFRESLQVKAIHRVMHNCCGFGNFPIPAIFIQVNRRLKIGMCFQIYLLIPQSQRNTLNIRNQFVTKSLAASALIQI